MNNRVSDISLKNVTYLGHVTWNRDSVRGLCVTFLASHTRRFVLDLKLAIGTNLE